MRHRIANRKLNRVEKLHLTLKILKYSEAGQPYSQSYGKEDEFYFMCKLPCLSCTLYIFPCYMICMIYLSNIFFRFIGFVFTFNFMG